MSNESRIRRETCRGCSLENQESLSRSTCRFSAYVNTQKQCFLPRRFSSHFVSVLALFIFAQQSHCFTHQTPPIHQTSTSKRKWGRQSTFLAFSPKNGEKNNHKPQSAGPLLPKHVAFVCDGNSRWARQRGLPVIAGHAAGADRLVDVVLPSLQERGVQYCTMYGFSTENWQRSSREIKEIFVVMERTAERVCSRLQHQKQPIRVQILGNLEDDRIPDSLRAALYKLQLETKALCDKRISENDTTEPQTLCLAINYGGRQDILDAAKQLARRAISEGGNVEDTLNTLNQYTEDDFGSFLCTKGVPDPDLIIRTSGECRLSNFLLWNAAYAELYFTDTLWPDFDQDAMEQALAWYAMRKRRFGSRLEA